MMERSEVIAALQDTDGLDMTSQPRIATSTTEYSGAIFHVDDVQVELPAQDGGAAAVTVRRQVVRHQPAVVLLVHDCECDMYLLEREYRVGPNAFAFGLPAGLVDEGETPIAAALRELSEETGVEAGTAQVDVDTVGTFYSSEGMTDERVTIMVLHLRAWDRGPRHFDADENVQSAWVDWKTLWSMGIDSSNSVIALQHEAMRRGGLSHTRASTTSV